MSVPKSSKKAPYHCPFDLVETGSFSFSSEKLSANGLPVFGSTKNPASSVKVLYSSRKVVVEFDFESNEGNRAKIEVNPDDIVGIKQEETMMTLELSKPAAPFAGQQDIKGNTKGHSMFGGYKGTTRYTPKEVFDFSDGEVPRARFCQVHFSDKNKCNSFIANLKELDPCITAALARGVQPGDERKYFSAEELAALQAAVAPKAAKGRKRSAPDPAGAAAGPKKVRRLQATKPKKIVVAAAVSTTCEGCKYVPESDEEELELEVICNKCNYVCCENCSVHSSKGRCPCKR